ncbi:lysophospholipid acyltransferase family protein [soil metagenome]
MLSKTKLYLRLFMGNLISALFYYLFLLPISWLPLPVLYLISDFLYFILYSLLGYRKKIVWENLRNSFPEKSEEELKVIMRKFYGHFCDVVGEGLKSLSTSEKQLQRQVEPVNTELIEKYYQLNKSVILCTGHYANWEWPAVAFIRHSSHKALGIYLPLKSKFFDQKLQDTRSKFGLTLMSVKEVAEYFEDHKNETCSYGFIFDQSPSNPKKGHWMKFLNQDTSVMTGVERYAVKYDFPVIYGKIIKLKRGKYRITYELVTDTPRQTKENEITEKIYHINESIIRSAPEYWLWTHRRWKHKKSGDEEKR